MYVIRHELKCHSYLTLGYLLSLAGRLCTPTRKAKYLYIFIFSTTDNGYMHIVKKLRKYYYLASNKSKRAKANSWMFVVRLTFFLFLVIFISCVPDGFFSFLSFTCQHLFSIPVSSHPSKFWVHCSILYFAETHQISLYAT